MFNLKRAIQRGSMLALLLAASAPVASFGQSHKLFNSGEVRVYEKGAGVTAVSPQAYFEVDRTALASLRQSSTIEILEVPLFVAGTDKVKLVDLELTEFSVLSPRAELIVTTANGTEPAPRPTVKLYRGT